MTRHECARRIWSTLSLAVTAGGCLDGSDGGATRTFQAVAEPVIDWSPRSYVAYRTEVPVMVDGRLTDSVWQAAAWTQAFTDIEGPARQEPRFATRAKMLWDSSYFYVAAELEEPHVWATLRDRDAVIYLDNDFEVFIDPDGDTHEYYELEVNALGTEWDLLLLKPYRDGGPAVHAWDIPGLRTAVFVDGTLNDPADTDRGWTVEIAFPWAALAEAAHRASPPESGDQWRVNFSRVQWRVEIEDGRYRKIVEPVAGRERPEDNWVWSPQGIVNMHYPEMWGIVQFSSAVAGEREERFTPDPDDQAKWLLRRIYYRQRVWYATHGAFTSNLRDLGITRTTVPGFSEPRIAVIPDYFLATITREDGTRLRLTPDGRVRHLP